jgi:hypothetical protein
VRTTLRFGALSAVAAVAALASWTLAVRPVQAPEPAKLSANLGSTRAATAATVTPTGTSETAVNWPSSYTYVGAFVVTGGQPCNPGPALNGTVLMTRIVRSGGYAKCVPLT